MHKYLLVFLILIFTPYTSNSYEDKPILLDRSYIRVGYGLNMVPDINNVKQQGEGLYSIDQTFPNALFDMNFETGSTFAVAFGSKFDSFAVEMSIENLVSDVDTFTSDTLNKSTSGDLSITVVLINGLYYPRALDFNDTSVYLGAGIGVAHKVDLDESGITGQRVDANETFRSFTDAGNISYQYLVGVEHEINKTISLFLEAKSLTVKSVEFDKDSHVAGYKEVDIKPYTALIGLKFYFWLF